MQRRQFVKLSAGAVLWPLNASAQQSSKKALIAYLSGGTQSSRAPLLAAFQRGMGDLGMMEGQSYALEARYDDGDFSRLPTLATELDRMHPDVFLISTTPPILPPRRSSTPPPS
jgi:hypothetical protein